MNAILPLLSVALSFPLTTTPPPEFQIAQVDRAEDVCTDQVRDRGWRVEDVLETNEHSNGVEVIMRVSRRGDESTVGCDYSRSSGDTQLYRIEDDRDYRGDRNDDDDYGDNDDRFYRSGDEVGDRQEAERIARDAVGDQLGIDNPNSEIVEIKDVQRENRTWIVEGEANGAPFRVQIRRSDGSVQDFQLY
jgi:hypothetical protein